MYEIDFEHPCRVHFIGIGGISMSGFAELMHRMGFTVSGSDRQESKFTKHLESLGISIVYGQRAENITNDIKLVIYTAAIAQDNPELTQAREYKIPTLTRAAMVGQVMKNYPSAIAISGTHGKTTTTSMAAELFLQAGLDPTVSVGGVLDAIGGNIRVGHSEHFITEACEYTNSFLQFFPTVGIILNIEEDHMDFFKDIDDIRNSFRAFAKLLPANGALIINADIENYEAITKELDCQVLTYSLNNTNAAFRATDISFDEKGCGAFTSIINGKNAGRFTLQVPGLHNISNCLACLALASLYEIENDTIQDALTAFHGTERRFEYKGKKNGFTIIDDYAHHPTEITGTLSTAAKIPHGKLWCAFQPHTYTRTRAFLKEFAESLCGADEIILLDIYAAREKDPGDISSLTLAAELEKLGKRVHYFPTFDEAEKFILENLVDDDLLITIGAGNVVEIGENLLKA